jgi:hypothetical protein
MTTMSDVEIKLLPEHVFNTIELEEGERVVRWAWSDYVAQLLGRPSTSIPPPHAAKDEKR